MNRLRTTAAVAGLGLATVTAYLVLDSQKEATAAGAPGVTQSKVLDELRYPPGSPQLNFLAIRAVDATPMPALDPLPARLVYDENHTVRVFSPLAGRVLSIDAQLGQRVQAQQVLAWIDSPDYGAAVADWQKAQADNDVKQAAQQRADRLLGAGVIAARDAESARADARTAHAELERATARLRGLGSRAEQGRYALRAPIGGVIAERHLNPGQEVRPDAADPQFIITDPQQLDVVADVAESDVARLSVGQSVLVESDNLAFKPARARITSVGVAVDANTRRVPVRAHLIDQPVGARAELFVRFTALDEHGASVLAVPNGAVVASGVQSFVFVEREPGVLVKRPVEFALRARDVSYVKTGLQSGDRVVTQGALLVDADMAGGH